MSHSAELEGFGPAHHWRDGVTFRRCIKAVGGKAWEVGAVLIAFTVPTGEYGGDTTLSVLIPPAEWAAIVAHVDGYDSDDAEVAAALHAGRLSELMAEDERGPMAAIDTEDARHHPP